MKRVLITLNDEDDLKLQVIGNTAGLNTEGRYNRSLVIRYLIGQSFTQNGLVIETKPRRRKAKASK